MKENTRFRNEESRNLMAFVVACDPSVKKVLRTFLRSVRDIKHDRMSVRQADNTYKDMPDPSAWSGVFKKPSLGYHGMTLLRSENGEWWINGF